MNFIVVVSDTLRRDHLRAYGNNKMITPNLDRFAKESIVFDSCRPRSFPTIPTRGDLMTGAVDFLEWGWGPLPTKYDTLAGILGRNGYQTTAVLDTPYFIREGYGYDRGFERFITILGQETGSEMIESRHEWRFETDRFAPTTFLTAERWLQEHRKEKFFLYVDTWDPHEPWDPPIWYTQMYQPSYNGKASLFPTYGNYKEAGVSEEALATAHACYQGEVTMVDRWFGRFMDTVDLLGLAENTAVIFLSDHGFYFGEHDLFGKSVFWKKGDELQSFAHQYWSPLYEEVTRVPLMMRIPKHKAQRIGALVSVPDVMPTVLELAGLSKPKGISPTSTSTIPLIEDEAEETHECTFTSGPLYNEGGVSFIVSSDPHVVRETSPATISSKEWTLLYAKQGLPSELYNLSSDPKQKKNVFDSNKDVARELHRNYVDFLKKEKVDPRILKPRLSIDMK